MLDILPTLPASEPPIVDSLKFSEQVQTSNNDNNHTLITNVITPYLSPLYLSVITRQHTVVKHLLMAGANPSVCDRNGNTALHLSAHMGYPEAMKHLLEHKSHLITGPAAVPVDILIMNVNGEL